MPEAGSTELERLIADAAAIATRYGISTVSAYHLLYSISGTEEGRRVIERMGGRPAPVRRFLENALHRNSARDREGGVCRFDESLHRVVTRPVLRARAAHRPVTLADVLLEMLHPETECAVTHAALEQGGVASSCPYPDDRSDFRLEEEMGAMRDPFESDEDPDLDRGYWMPPLDAFDEDDDLVPDHGLEEPEPPHPEAFPQPGDSGPSGDEHEAAARRALRCLTELAGAGELDPVTGRDGEIERLVAILLKRRKPNALLVGEAGVGKTALVEGLALRMAASEVPSALAGRPVFEVSMTELVAGTRYRGDFEARLTRLLEIASRARAILFIDEVHMIVGAGATGTRGGMDASNILKPALARGEITLIGATTPGEMRDIRRDAALMRRLELLPVVEPAAEAVFDILMRAKEGYESHHAVAIPEEICRMAIPICEEHLPARRFPDKALDLVDAAATFAALRAAAEVTEEDLRAAAVRFGGLRASGPDRARLGGLARMETMLKSRILGQKAALETLMRGARAAAMGLQPGGVAASFLLNGPTGSGKTESAIGYAEGIGLPLVRIDMSEYMEKHAVSRLIGAPPGYVGFEGDGLLVSSAETHPEFVLLLDEAEKAHPEVFDILLQVLDHGVLRAGDGRPVSMNGAHLFLTSNIGHSGHGGTIGFGPATDVAAQAREEIARSFRKEFLSRIRNVVEYAPLDTDALEEIAIRRIDRIMGSLARVAEIELSASGKLAFCRAIAGRAGHARQVEDLVDAEFRDPIVAQIGATADRPHLAVDWLDEGLSVRSA